MGSVVDMLVVRAPQLEVLSAARVRAFADALVADVTRFWPETCASLGAEAVRARVERGVTRARSYKLDAEGDIGRYVNTTFALGADFDSDDRYPWAGPILRAPIAGKVKMDKICARTAEVLAREDTSGA